MNQVIYKCQDKDCGKDFTVEQGSRRKYCDACTLKRILLGKKQKGKGKEVGDDSVN
jgi:DNA-directed RNA polymerase subunit RPC12/RpoP